MDLAGRVRRLRRVSLKEVFWRACRRVLRGEVVLVMAVALEGPWRESRQEVPERPGLTFAWLDDRSLGVLQRPGLGYDDRATLERSLARLDRGDRCLTGFVDGEPVTYLWLTHGTRQMTGDELELGQGQVWIYKSYTHPDWRRQGLTQMLGRHALEDCAGGGDHVAFVDMLAVNRPSVAAFRGIGFRTLGRYVVLHGPDGTLRADVPARLHDRIMALPGAPPRAAPPPD
jgi:GNAT superfamily N-acetyltransferase